MGGQVTEILATLSWPHFAFLTALICVLLFRAQIGNLLSRVTSIDKSGIKAQPAPEAQREEKQREAAQALLDAIGTSIVLKDVEARIRKELTDRGLETHGDTANVLIRHLAATRILLEFEQVHNLIFGSQIFLLKKLNEVAGQGKSKEFVEDYFTRVQELFPEAFREWTLEQYLAFLLGRLLIVAQDGKYHITNLGVEFLTWMARNGRREDGAF